MVTARFNRSLLAIATLTLSVACASGIKDIRPDSVKDGVTAEEQARGRALLAKAAENAGGRELLSKHPGFTTEMDDVWENFMGKMLFLKYDERQKLKVESRGPRVEDVKMTLVGGSRAGEVWGLENNKVYTKVPGAEKTFTDDEITMLYVKNPAALVLVPLRLGYADKVAYMGQIEYEGKTYDQVFATWETFDPNQTYDQWVVWIDTETGNIAKAKLTIREYTGSLADEAVAEFEDYKRFGDVLIPTTISAMFSLDDGDPIRTWTVTSFAWTDEGAATVADGEGPASQPADLEQVSLHR